jgi:nicotinamidase-related amidase
MPATALDPHTALVVIDLQKGLASFPFTRPFGEIVAAATRLAEAFRRAALPVVLVRVLPGRPDEGWRAQRVTQTVPVSASPVFAELMPALGPLPGDVVITKRQWNAFYGTELDLQLRRRGVTGIVLAGVRTCIGVEGTARAAHERAFNLTFAEDAIGDVDADAHTHAVTKIFPRLGEIDGSERIVSLLPRAP